MTALASRKRNSGAAREDLTFREVPLSALLPLWFAGAFVLAYVLRTYPGRHWLGADAHAYWLTAHHHSLYAIAPGAVDAYNYSPAFAQVIRPLALLPWPAFLAVWIIAQSLVFAWLLAPLGWRWAVPFWMCCSLAIGFGNIWPFLAAVFVLGRTRPAFWAFAVLTKVTPGVGMLWHVARGEWRRLGIAILTVAGVGAVSAAIDPAAWEQWIDFMRHSSGDGSSLAIRLLIAATLVVVAARRPRSTWLLPIALIMSVPILAGWQWITVLAAIPRLLGGRGGSRNVDAARRSGGVQIDLEDADVTSLPDPAIDS